MKPASHFSQTLLITVLALGLTGCKADKTSPCGDQTCREGYTCDTIHDECVVPAQLELCVGEADGSECILNGADGFVCDQEVCLQSDCGDGILDVHTGEECDDGNNVDDDACPNNCTLNCGDGTANPGEECDGSDLNSETCISLGYDNGQLACEQNCTFDESLCIADCGNGLLHSSEDCDDGNSAVDDGCSDTCEVEFGWECQGSPSVCEQLPYIAISGGGWHVCAHRSDDTIWCWGLNANGQLGTPGIPVSAIPSQVTGLVGVVAVEAGGAHTCAIKDDGTVWCWGMNNFGQLGNGEFTGDTIVNSDPVEVIGLTNVVALSSGGAHTCAVKDDGTVWCWGLNDFGQLGNGSATAPVQSPNPDAAQISGFTGAASISAGAAHTCVIKDDGTTWCWGWNNQGQVGNGSTAPSVTTPEQANQSSAVSIAAGGGHTCAVLTDGTARCWGWNESGQVGIDSGLFVRSTAPVLVGGISNVEAIFAGVAHSCALLTDSTVWCWGLNEFGQLGNGVMNTVPNDTPLQVSGITDAALISSKGNNSCSIRSEGRAWCWGRNIWGQLGDGTNVDKDEPVPVVLIP